MLVVVVLAACAACGETPPATSPPAAPVPSTNPVTTGSPEDLRGDDPDLSPLAAAAVADLVERTDGEPEDVTVTTFEQVTWPDGSLGCPEPGMSYTQALVEGWRLILSHGDILYAYHAGGDGDPFLCDNPLPIAPTS